MRTEKNMQQQVVVRALLPFGTSIFTEINALAAEYNAVNLSQGAPDFDGPEDIRKLAAQAIMRGPNQYVPSQGILQLRQAVAAKMKRFYGVELDAEGEVTVTAGATEGLCAVLLGILEPGDEVILLEPCYDTYAPVAAMAQAKVRFVPLTRPDFALPHQELEAAFNENTKAIVINTPQNPCGKVFTREELSLIGELCSRFDAYAVSDEVYEHLVYNGASHVTLLSIPSLRQRAFVVSSSAKTFSMTGWKVGFVVAAPGLTQAVRMSHQFISFCTPGALQEAMAYAIELPDEYYSVFLKEYDGRRQRLGAALQEVGFGVSMPAGTYYICVDIKPLGINDDMEACRILAKEAGVAAIPCSYFWKDRRDGRDLLRFCFCKKDETLEEGIRRLRAWRR